MNIKQGYKQTEIGIIPEDWEVKKFSEIGECVIGLTYKPENVKEDGILVLRSSNVKGNALKFDDNVFVNIAVGERLITQVGDILICVRNGSRNLIGKSAIIDENSKGLTFGAFMSIFRTPYYDFVFQLFQSDILQRQIKNNLGATINQITNKDLNSFEIPFPPKQEQTAIATALSDIDALIGELDKLIAKKQGIKQATMQQLLTGKKRLAGFSGEWEVKRLGELLDYEQPTKYLVSSTEYNDHNNVAVLTAGKSFVLGYTNEEHGIFQNLPVIIFDDFTTTTKYVDFPFKVKSSAMKMLKPKNEQVNLKFLFEKIQTIRFLLNDHKRYWISEYQKLEIELPSIEEQNAIANILSDMDAEISQLEGRRAKMGELKQGMMQELLTGRIRLI
jgi:type I restriction enzyme S subunit